MGKPTTHRPTRGQITSGLTPRTLVKRTVEFVRTQLAAWRDDPERPDANSEDVLNGQLCKFLDVASRQQLPMVHFHHEEPQRGRARVDLAALPVASVTIGSRRYNQYRPFLVFEGKRLPAPSAAREREYVRGPDRPTGGIQRFKRGLHGADLDSAAMIGYLQAGTAADWYHTINQWVMELTTLAGDERWSQSDCLADLQANPQNATAICESHHARSHARSDTIVLYHLWVEL